MILATAISLPLSQLMFCIHAVAGPNTSHFLITDFYALVIVLTGFTSYYLFSPEGKRQRHGAPDDLGGTLRAERNEYTGGAHRGSGSKGYGYRGDQGGERTGAGRPLLINNPDTYDSDE